MATTSAPTTTTEAHLFGLPLKGGVPLMIVFLLAVVGMVITAMRMCFRLGKARSKLKYQKFDNKGHVSEGKESDKLSRRESLPGPGKPLFDTERVERILAKMRQDEAEGIVPSFDESRKETFGRPLGTPLPQSYIQTTGNISNSSLTSEQPSTSSIGHLKSTTSEEPEGIDMSGSSLLSRLSPANEGSNNTVVVGINSQKVSIAPLTDEQIAEAKKTLAKSRKRKATQKNSNRKWQGKADNVNVSAGTDPLVNLASGKSLNFSSDA